MRQLCEVRFELASHEIPHPRLTDQTFALMIWQAANFFAGDGATSLVHKVVPEIREPAISAGFPVW